MNFRERWAFTWFVINHLQVGAYPVIIFVIITVHTPFALIILNITIEGITATLLMLLAWKIHWPVLKNYIENGWEND